MQAIGAVLKRDGVSPTASPTMDSFIDYAKKREELG